MKISEDHLLFCKYRHFFALLFFLFSAGAQSQGLLTASCDADSLLDELNNPIDQPEIYNNTKTRLTAYLDHAIPLLDNSIYDSVIQRWFSASADKESIKTTLETARATLDKIVNVYCPKGIDIPSRHFALIDTVHIPQNEPETIYLDPLFFHSTAEGIGSRAMHLLHEILHQSVDIVDGRTSSGEIIIGALEVMEVAAIAVAADSPKLARAYEFLVLDLYGELYSEEVKRQFDDSELEEEEPARNSTESEILDLTSLSTILGADCDGENKCLDTVDTKDAYSGFTRIVTPTSALRLGQGFNTITGQGRSNIVDASMVQSNSELEIDYDIDLIDSYKSLAKTLRIDASAAYSGGGFSGSASVSMFKSAKMSSKNVYMLVKMTVTNEIQTLSSYSFITEMDTNNFFDSYGNSFVSSVKKGAELYALLEFSSSENVSYKSMRADVEASFSGFGGSGSIQKTLETKAKDYNVRILYTQNGGGVGRKFKYKQATPEAPVAPAAADDAVAEVQTPDDYVDVVALTPDQLVNRIRQFSAEVRDQGSVQNSVVLSAEVTDYSVVPRGPDVQIPNYDLIRYNWLMEDMFNLRLMVEETLNTAEQVVYQTKLDSINEDILLKASTTASYSTYTLKIINRLIEEWRNYPTRIPKIDAEARFWKTAIANKILFDVDDPVEMGVSKPNCENGEECCPVLKILDGEDSLFECLYGVPFPLDLTDGVKTTYLELDGGLWRTHYFWYGNVSKRSNVKSNYAECQIGLTDQQLKKRGLKRLVAGFRKGGKLVAPRRKTQVTGICPSTPSIACDHPHHEWCINHYYTNACVVNTLWFDKFIVGKDASNSNVLFGEACAAAKAQSTESN